MKWGEQIQCLRRESHTPSVLSEVPWPRSSFQFISHQPRLGGAPPETHVGALAPVSLATTAFASRMVAWKCETSSLMLARRRFPPVYLLQSELRRLPLAAGTHAWGRRHGGTVRYRHRHRHRHTSSRASWSGATAGNALRSVGDVAWVGIRAIVTR